MRWTDVAGYGLDDGETPAVRCKPEGIDELSRVTKFSRKELQIMYRGFKQVGIFSAHVRGTSAAQITFSAVGFRILVAS